MEIAMALREAGGGTRRKPRSAVLLNLAHRTKTFALCHRLTPTRITVLAYHRIADHEDETFHTFVPNVSATPNAFAGQMDFLREHFRPISLDDLLAWLRNEAPLPAHAALVTFDDGYRDNFTHAMPILKERGIPAVLFLATDCVGSSTPFYWDQAAFLFSTALCDRADLPLLGPQLLNDREGRRLLARRWVAAAKKLPPEQRAAAVEALGEALEAPSSDGAFTSLHVTWDEVRTMAANGIAIGAHTCNHSILSQVSQEEARRQICGSKAAIETAIGRKVIGFAYPNGHPSDYDEHHVAILRNAGFGAAFTLNPGPCWPREVRSSPFQIRRIGVTTKDDLPRFSAKVIGLGRAWDNI